MYTTIEQRWIRELRHQAAHHSPAHRDMYFWSLEVLCDLWLRDHVEQPMAGLWQVLEWASLDIGELSRVHLRVIDAEEEITCDEMVDIIEKTLKWSGPS